MVYIIQDFTDGMPIVFSLTRPDIHSFTAKNIMSLNNNLKPKLDNQLQQNNFETLDWDNKGYKL